MGVNTLSVLKITCKRVIKAQIMADLQLGKFDLTALKGYSYHICEFLSCDFCVELETWVEKTAKSMYEKYINSKHSEMIAYDIYSQEAKEIASAFIDKDIELFGTLNDATHYEIITCQYLDLLESYWLRVRLNLFIQDKLKKIHQ